MFAKKVRVAILLHVLVKLLITCNKIKVVSIKLNDKKTARKMDDYYISLTIL